jgi:hypothetical protein
MVGWVDQRKEEDDSFFPFIYFICRKWADMWDLVHLDLTHMLLSVNCLPRRPNMWARLVRKRFKTSKLNNKCFLSQTSLNSGSHMTFGTRLVVSDTIPSIVVVFIFSYLRLQKNPRVANCLNGIKGEIKLLWWDGISRCPPSKPRMVSWLVGIVWRLNLLQGEILGSNYDG